MVTCTFNGGTLKGKLGEFSPRVLLQADSAESPAAILKLNQQLIALYLWLINTQPRHFDLEESREFEFITLCDMAKYIIVPFAA
ncbi:hypothetical protein PISL3812_02182 [Talaromyces islandicus]|uniref:Uncharacterized protein n=1 Tax=Talaromyces islandicus TaxID=28573 RepID=A0A0U1LRF6_TALIS|nr:hypothetical protein PISL3812_02182 [Talaromyces islandicus]